MKITATVISLNEERRIGAALESLSWADEIVVVDSGSTDGTLEIAERFTDRILHNAWPGYAAQKNYAAAAARNDWIFSIDADEVVSERLAKSITSLGDGSPGVRGYRMARRAWYIDRWVNHSGWYPDWQVRLYDRRHGQFEGQFVHESVKLSTPVGTLAGDIDHYTVDSLSDHHRRIDGYTTLAAKDRHARGKRFSPIRAVVQPPLTFLQTYLLKQGFRDGPAGLAIAGFAAYYVFLRELKLRMAATGEKEQD